MWVPRSTDELLAALPSFAESANLDVKREFPAAGKNEDVAVDIAAMSVDGGTIIYGIDEDKATGTFDSNPIPLKGLVERVTNIVQSRIGGPPSIEVIQLPQGEGEGLGFLVVVVPPSPTAPHMVLSKGQFYGRGPGGNVILTQGEVDRLYERRRRAEIDRRNVLTDWVADSPYEAEGSFFFVIHPVLGDDSLLDRAWPGDLGGQLYLAINSAVSQVGANVVLALGIGELTTLAVGKTMRGWSITQSEKLEYAHALSILNDGTIRYAFKGAVSTREFNGQEYVVFRDRGCAQAGAQMMCFASVLYQADNYFGQVDILFDVRGTEGSIGFDWVDGMVPPPRRPTFEGPMTNEMTVPASALATDNWAQTARDLFDRMKEVVGPRRSIDFFGG